MAFVIPVCLLADRRGQESSFSGLCFARMPLDSRLCGNDDNAIVAYFAKEILI
jgi:hypothetical protein